MTADEDQTTSVSCSDKAGFSEFLATEELEGFLHAD
jgi:hypothetical protein